MVHNKYDYTRNPLAYEFVPLSMRRCFHNSTTSLSSLFFPPFSCQRIARENFNSPRDDLESLVFSWFGLLETCGDIKYNTQVLYFFWESKRHVKRAYSWRSYGFQSATRRNVNREEIERCLYVFPRNCETTLAWMVETQSRRDTAMIVLRINFEIINAGTKERCESFHRAITFNA